MRAPTLAGKSQEARTRVPPTNGDLDILLSLALPSPEEIKVEWAITDAIDGNFTLNAFSSVLFIYYLYDCRLFATLSGRAQQCVKFLCEITGITFVLISEYLKYNFSSKGSLLCQSWCEKEGSEYKGTWSSSCNPRRVVTSSDLAFRKENWCVGFQILK